MSWIIRSSLVWSSSLFNMCPFKEAFPGQILSRLRKSFLCEAGSDLVEYSVLKKRRKDDCWDGRLERKCWRWVEVKEPGAKMRAQEKKKEGSVGRKEERYNRNERVLLLLIIVGVTCQRSLRGFHLGVWYQGAQTVEPHYSPFPPTADTEGGAAGLNTFKKGTPFSSFLSLSLPWSSVWNAAERTAAHRRCLRTVVCPSQYLIFVFLRYF